MSTESRLDRLGLRHLADKPDELKKALEDGMSDYDRKVAAWHAERERLRNAVVRLKDGDGRVVEATIPRTDGRATLGALTIVARDGRFFVDEQPVGPAQSITIDGRDYELTVT